MPALKKLEAWEKFSKAEIQNLEILQGKTLKRTFNLPITKSYIGLIIETGVWPAVRRINHSSLMLYHNIINSNKDRLAKYIIQEQRAQNHRNTLYGKMRTRAEELNIKLEAVETMKKIRKKKKNKRDQTKNSKRKQVGKKRIHCIM